MAEREIGSEPVLAFARRLAESKGEPAVAFEPADGLTVREAQAVALWFNPDVRVAREKADGIASIARASGRWADPQFGVENGRKKSESERSVTQVTIQRGGNAGEIPFEFDRDVKEKTDRNWIVGASLGITIPISGRVGLERRAWGKAHEAALLEAAEAEWRLLTDVETAWLAWSAEGQRLGVIDEQLKILGRIADMAQSLSDAGEISPGSAGLFAIERGRLEALRRRVSFEETASRYRLHALMGLLPNAPVALVPGCPVEEPADVDDWPARIAASHPVIARLRAEYETAEAQLRVELRKQVPDITITPSFSDEQDESAIVLGLGFPIPVWNANRQGIAEAAAARDAARARVLAEFERTVASAAQAESGRDGARAQRTHLVEEVAPDVDRQLEETLALLGAGEIDIAVFYEILSQSFEIRIEVVEALRDEGIANARLAAFLRPRLVPEQVEKEDMP